MHVYEGEQVCGCVYLYMHIYIYIYSTHMGLNINAYGMCVHMYLPTFNIFHVFLLALTYHIFLSSKAIACQRRVSGAASTELVRSEYRKAPRI